MLTGCATFNPLPLDEARYRNRAETQTDGEVRVTAAVLSAEETKEVFDLDLYKKGIQPIWLEIENNSEKRTWLPPVGIDRDYFAPLEVAYMHHYTFSKSVNKKMDHYLFDQGLGPYVSPGKVRSGFVFTHLDLGTKAFNVDIFGGDQVRTFTFFVAVPGLRVSHRDVDFDNLYSRDEIISYEVEEDLRKALERLPCCTTNADGSIQGDPLNLVIISGGKALHYALIRRDWHETESAKTGSAKKRREAAIFAKQYRHAPVNPFYLYGRPQDAAFRKSRETADEKNHLRLWLSPMRFKDKPVWVGQISREIKVRYLPNTFKLEPLVDEARNYILQDLWYSQRLAKFGYVKGVGAVSMSEPRTDFAGDPYFTDGRRIVMWVSSRPVSLSEVETLRWEIPSLRKNDN
jgi:hypothetical protein